MHVVNTRRISSEGGWEAGTPQNSATFLEEELDTSVREHTLLHGEALLVIASRNSEDVTLELITWAELLLVEFKKLCLGPHFSMWVFFSKLQEF